MNTEDGLALLHRQAPGKIVAIRSDHSLPANWRQGNPPDTRFMAYIHLSKDTLLAGRAHTLEGAVMEVLAKLAKQP